MPHPHFTPTEEELTPEPHEPAPEQMQGGGGNSQPSSPLQSMIDADNERRRQAEERSREEQQRKEEKEEQQKERERSERENRESKEQAEREHKETEEENKREAERQHKENEELAKAQAAASSPPTVAPPAVPLKGPPTEYGDTGGTPAPSLRRVGGKHG